VGTARRVAGGLLFALFASVIAVRPLVSSPAITASLGDGLPGWQVLALVALVVVSLLVVVLRLTSRDGTESPEPHGDREGTFWDARKSEGGQVSAGGDRDGAATAEGDTARESDTPDSGGVNPLSGQGGTRDRDFEIEAEPPDALLEDHLEHLQAEFDGDRAVAEDLDTLATVAAEESDREIPERCPQEHCDAVWSGRTVLGVASGRYERLDDGHVQCLECEETTELG
jgi:hypothetical protein